MGFADRYVSSLNASTLQDDEQHHAAEPLFAAAVADMAGAGIGALLCRVKFADGTLNRLFEGNQQNMAQLLRIWTASVIEKGQTRRWVKTEDVAIAHGLYKRVAEASLAHWLDGHCKVCAGTGVTSLLCNRKCTSCAGSGAAEISHLCGYEKKIALDMVSELAGLCDSHSRRATARLR